MQRQPSISVEMKHDPCSLTYGHAPQHPGRLSGAALRSNSLSVAEGHIAGPGLGKRAAARNPSRYECDHLGDPAGIRNLGIPLSRDEGAACDGL